MSLELNKKISFKQEFKKRCFQFALSILKLSEELNYKQTNRAIINQLIRSATSIGANVVEGGNSTSRREFINYFQIALKSASETAYWLVLFKEINKELAIKLYLLLTECVEIKKLLSTIILNTKNNSKF